MPGLRFARRPLYDYRTYGLRVSSEVPLCLPSASDGPPDVRVRFGAVERPCPSDLPPGEGCWRAASGRASYSWSNVGDVEVRDGAEVVVDPAETADEDDLRLAVLGPLLATVLHQRGLLVLHASAVAGPGGAVAVAAHSGTGKSTTAGALVDRGYRLVTDDVLAVDLGGPAPTVVPGGSGVKLWPASAEALGRPARSLPTIGARYVKRVWDVERGATPVPLRALYVLEAALEEPENGAAVEPLGRPRAVGEVMSRSYCSELLRLHGADRNLAQAADLVRRVPVVVLRRGPSLDRFGEWASRVAADVEKRAGAPPGRPAH